MLQEFSALGFKYARESRSIYQQIFWALALILSLPVYQAFYNKREIIPGVYFHVPYNTPNNTGGIFLHTVRHTKLYPLVCHNFKFDTCKFTKVILPAKYIIYAFKSYS